MLLAYVISLFLLSGSALCASVSYSYDDQAAWASLPNSQCGEMSQSPINIVTNDLTAGDEIGLTDLSFNYLDQAVSGEWDDNGHSLILNPTAGQTPRTVETYRGTYELLQFHFHWGANDDQGAEHTVNGKQYSGELHFVHRAYQPSRDATSFDYYTVVGVLLEANDDLSADGTLWASFSDIPGYNDTLAITDSDGITYSDLLPSDRSYYYYNGSLTTPLCNEVVQWVLLQTPIQVPSSFFTMARTTEQEDGDPLTFNFRNIQALNGRTVYDSSSSAVVVIPTTAILLVSLLLGFFLC